MKLQPDDPRLTALALGELDAAEAADVRAALVADPALQVELDDIIEVSRVLELRLAPADSKLQPAQREKLLGLAREADRRRKILPFPTSSEGLQAWFIPAAAAAVLIVTTTIFIRMSHQHSVRPPATAATGNASKPLPAAKPDVTHSLPPALPAGVAVTGPLSAVETPVLQLPIHAGTPALASISKLIFDGKNPPPASIRLEEILNSFPFRFNGMAAIARSATPWHPDSREGEIPLPVATLSSEITACPWKPSASLLFISLRGNARSESQIKLVFRANPETVLRYRLLGYRLQEGSSSGEMPARLPANATTTLALEIESANDGDDFGWLEWSANSQKAPSISITRRKDAEPSDDARFAALACIYAQWLSGERAGLIDPEIISALARENTTATLPADRAEFLRMIDKSLHL